MKCGLVSRLILKRDCVNVNHEISSLLSTRNQAVARIADRTTSQGTYLAIVAKLHLQLF